jgi:hypothetical protein
MQFRLRSADVIKTMPASLDLFDMLQPSGTVPFSCGVTKTALPGEAP